jgi:outer membrane protein OmpA-like peptidoglycan-associated protein
MAWEIEVVLHGRNAMKKSMNRLWVGMVLSLAIGILPAFAASGDLEGSKDHPLLKRYEGAEIVGYDHKEFDEYKIPLAVKANAITKSMQVDGELTHLIYMIPFGRSIVEVIKNYETEFKKTGYKTLFTSDPKDAMYMSDWLPQHEKEPFLGIAYGMPGKVVAWSKSRPEGDIYVLLAAQESRAYNSPFKEGQTILLMDVVVKKAMEGNKLVGAKEMADQIAESGRVALYGIYFDLNKTDIKPESEPTLKEIATLLQTHAGMKLLVVGHTDNIGSLAANTDLSQRRAQVVVERLVSKYAIAKDRLTPIGVSFAAPVASNKTDEGRAKNRRVELVEQ